MDELFVVETDDDIFVGTIEFVAGGVIVRNGFQGHPQHVRGDDIVCLQPASMHPAAFYVKAV